MTRRRQQGVALLVVLTVLVLGVAWFAIGAGKSLVVTDYQREAKTGTALREAKAAVLAYAAQYAARSTTAEPGQMPCPESLTQSRAKRPARSTFTSMCPFAGVNLIAFASKFHTTCCRRLESPMV